MSHLLSQFSLPLLLKELIEQSAKRRLFVTRVAFALFLFVTAAMFVVPTIYVQQRTAIGMLGVGRQVMTMLLMIQFMGIYLFLPALASGVITVEKERNTLALLFLTKLGPWTIVFEKYGSRLVPMFSLLLTSLPLLAFAYSLGGFDTFDLVCGVWFLSLSVIEVTSFAILASAFFRSTVAAFLATYFILFVFGFGIVISDEMFLGRALHDWFSEFGTRHMQWLFGSEGYRFGNLFQAMFFPPALVGMVSSPWGIGRLPLPYLVLLLSGVPTLLLSAGCLCLARVCVVRRAFLPPANPLLNVFKLLDRSFVWANQRFTQGVVLVKESQTLPDMQPVAWRDTAKRSLGQFRYLIRIFIVLEFPVLFFVLLAAIQGKQADASAVGVLTGLAWAVVLLILSTSAATLFATERGRQTLDVLLTSPLSSRQIILEKLSGVRRLMLVCAIPLLTCVIFETWWRSQTQQPWELNAVHVMRVTSGYRTQFYLWHEYLIGGLLTIFIYMNLIAWLCVWLGIKTTSPTRAIVTSLGTLLAWCLIPAGIMGSMMLYTINTPQVQEELAVSGFMLGLLSSPMMLIVGFEGNGVRWIHPAPYLAVVLNSLIYGGCWLFIRHRVLTRADNYLGRIPMHERLPASTDSEQIVEAFVTPVTNPATS